MVGIVDIEVCVFRIFEDVFRVFWVGVRIIDFSIYFSNFQRVLVIFLEVIVFIGICGNISKDICDVDDYIVYFCVIIGGF